MRKSWLPIPLILLTPLVLLVLVVAAGVYRFSLSDEQILSKFPAQPLKADPIVARLFDLHVTTPLTIPVPETVSFALLDRWDETQRWVMGDYDSGSERGQVALDTHSLVAVKGQEQRRGYAGIIRVSNQGSGVMSYLALFQYDELRLRMVMVSSEWLGDRVEIQSVTQENAQLNVSLLTHEAGEAFANTPTKFVSILFLISQKYQLIQQ
ncbi:hypothetical protein J0676_07845 [Vibrio sp. Vb2880]|uniref:Uncharacterized protein n=1 Tax=Vibrio furnissii TaxID=29494 RepID=A0A0Q2MJB7_VIBFU|nr:MULTISPECIES: hypothetical protein [Vibrio]MCE7626225.1 hypothetical protein [Vibrio fluvialis]KQH87786.1 hypothetical protein AMR76_00335 [Vibrio furnissii]MBO0213400.1 hypothetical protein [Vibrio sp. Vb2880]TRN24750.1 hypothetical protein DM784_10595 [Vibrio furnissii]UHJ62652.1 hypothetical protein LUM42_23910 [Vibrio furnissii]